jgi:peptidoglycan-associated lipoprotein
MKSNTLITLLAIAVLATSGAVGCRKKPSRLTNIPGKTTPIGSEQPGGPKLGPGVGVGGPDTRASDIATQGLPPAGGDFSNYDRDPQRFATETVYFDFDKSNIKPSELPKIRAVADAMLSMPGKAVSVEGHCDERGTEEYNRALGERRALSVREQLVQFGLNPDMIPTISYGEDRPVDPGHNEGAWARNRRAEFILLSPRGAP